MADINKKIKSNELLARLPLFTPHGWRCIGQKAAKAGKVLFLIVFAWAVMA